MVYCPNCGTPNNDNAKFCNQCGSEIVFDKDISSSNSTPNQCPRCAHVRAENSTLCMKCGFNSMTGTYKTQSQQSQTYQQTRQYTPTKPYVKDETDTYVYCCAFCFPIVGIVLWLVWRDEKPETANNLLIISIIAFVIDFFFTLLGGF